MSSVRNRNRGFTLLEILVAFIVLSIAGGALLQLFQGGLRNVALSSEFSHAALLARSKLAELEANSRIEVGEESGEFDETYQWRLTTMPYVEEGQEEAALQASYQALHIRLDVLWGGEDDSHEFTVESLLLTPATEGSQR